MRIRAFIPDGSDLANHSASAAIAANSGGSPFLAQGTLQVLLSRDILPLVSPPLTPRYNGAIEAGIGAVKSRALLIAASHGRADCWMCEDLEAALHEANHQARPFGRSGPSPQDTWNRRCPISAPQRRAFLATVANMTHDEVHTMIDRASVRPGYTPDEPLTASERATVARRAIRRALLELGLGDTHTICVQEDKRASGNDCDGPRERRVHSVRYRGVC